MVDRQTRTIVITGVTRGIGRAMIDGFIARGQTVCGCGRAAGDLSALQRKYPDPHGFSHVDVSDHAQVADWAARALDRLGPPDLLINNAGVINPPAPLWEISDDEFRSVIDVNVTGTVNVIRAFAPAMIKRGSGVIVNISSGWGRSTSPGVAPYCASKFAVEGLTQALAQDLPGGMAAVVVNPGIIDTNMLRTTWGDDAAAYPKPDEWADRAVPFLLGLGPADNGRSKTV
ncbi:MAG: SDR family oxidoreductase [Candidatus Latescibacterota bacterium]|nr:MAG: SDR family oxidoreductase [Candidatus Latescibacterota bacterium]